MQNQFLFGISLTASFLAGSLALFAPCCITFLFPSYLGTIFKSSSKVMFYTIIFALGLSAILIPVALGFRFFIFFFDAYHRQIYYFGGLFLIFMGVMTIKPVSSFQLSVFSSLRRQPQLGKNVNIASVFSLGLVSGLTSSCCAPVLFAAVTLTTLSPSLFQALIVSGAYVLGIVFPLFLLSLFYTRLTGFISGKNRQKIYNIFKWLAAAIFSTSGVAIIILTTQNKIQMYQMEGYSRGIRLTVFEIAKWFQNPIIDLVTFIIIIFVFYKLIKRK